MPPGQMLQLFCAQSHQRALWGRVLRQEQSRPWHRERISCASQHMQHCACHSRAGSKSFWSGSCASQIWSVRMVPSPSVPDWLTYDQNSESIDEVDRRGHSRAAAVRTPLTRQEPHNTAASPSGPATAAGLQRLRDPHLRPHLPIKVPARCHILMAPSGDCRGGNRCSASSACLRWRAGATSP